MQIPHAGCANGINKKRKEKKKKEQKKRTKLFCRTVGEEYNATNKKELMSEKKRDKMPRTLTAICVPGSAEIQNRIIEGGRVLAALIGKDFPVADDVWPEVNQFHRMIDDCGLKDTWVTMVSPEDQEVSNVDMAFCLSFFALTDSLFGRLYCRQSLTVL